MTFALDVCGSFSWYCWKG